MDLILLDHVSSSFLKVVCFVLKLDFIIVIVVVIVIIIIHIEKPCIFSCLCHTGLWNWNTHLSGDLCFVNKEVLCDWYCNICKATFLACICSKYPEYWKKITSSFNIIYSYIPHFKHWNETLQKKDPEWVKKGKGLYNFPKSIQCILIVSTVLSHTSQLGPVAIVQRYRVSSFFMVTIDQG